MGVVVGTAFGEGEHVSAEEAFVVGGVRDQEDTVSAVKEVVYRTRHIYHHQVWDVETLLVVGLEGTLGVRVSLHLEVLGMAVGRVGQDEYQGEVAVVFADACTGPERDSVDEEAAPAVEREVPGSSFAPSLGSVCHQSE